MPIRKTLKTLERECQEWNAKHAIGTVVKYFPIIGGDFCEHSTRSEASVLSGHTAVIWLDGVSGCVALDAVKI